MVKEITFYYHPECSGCVEIKPLIHEIAGIKGWKYREVNVEGCTTKICDELEFVPAIFLDGRKLDLREMNKLINFT